jgi:hypothetical protein
VLRHGAGPEWVDVAVQRWERFTGKTAERKPIAVHKRETAPEVSERLSKMGLGTIDDLQGNDVFIVEGRQERHGDKKAWELV